MIHEGKFIVLLGVDGSGKSTATSGLKKQATKNKIKFIRLHWRPYLLPSPRRFIGRTPIYDVTNPHAQEEHSLLVSLILLLYYFLDFWLGYILIIIPQKKRGAFVLFERYFFDVLFDPKRHRLKHTRLSTWLARIVPRPDAIFVLYGDSQDIYIRSQELKSEEIQRQQLLMRDYLFDFPNCNWLDVSRLSPIEVVDSILDNIYPDYF